MRKLLILLLVFAPLWAQNISIHHLRTNAEKFPQEVHSTVMALDQNDEPLQSLRAANFKINFGGVDVDSIYGVNTFGSSGQGLSILVNVDVSGSMGGKPLDNVKSGLLSFIDEKRPQDEICIMAFSEKAEVVCDFTTDTELLRKSIKDLKVWSGDTSLYYAIHKGLDHLGSKKPKHEGRYMILFSDGKEENPAEAYTLEAALEKARGKNLPIFSVGYTKVEKQFLQYMERIADETGGSYYHAPSPESLNQHFSKVQRQILGAWVLSYPVFALAGDGTLKELNITLQMGENSASLPRPAEVLVPVAPKIEPGDVREKRTTPLWVFLIIAFAVLLGIGLLLFFLNQGKKKRLAEEQRRQEEEERRHREELARQEDLRRAEEERKRHEQTRREEEAHIQREQQPQDRDRTVILGPGGAVPQSQAAELDMEVIYGTEQGRSFRVGAEGASIGRAAGNTILLNDQVVSSKHAKIYWSDGQFFIEDLGSMNGTYVNGQRVTISRIDNGSVFKIGSNEGKFHIN